LIRRPQPWSRVRFWLLDLAEEINAALRDQSLPAILVIDRVWITADGRAKLLDFPAPASDARPAAAGTPDTGNNSNPQFFLNQVAVAALEGQPVAPENAKAGLVAVPLPIHARELLGKMQAGMDFTLLTEELKATRSKLAVVSFARRLGVLGACSAFPFSSIAMIGAFMALTLASPEKARNSESSKLRECLTQLSALETNRHVTIRVEDKGSTEAAASSNQQLKEAYEIYIVGHFRHTITNAVTWSKLNGSLPQDQRIAAERLIARRAAPSEAELKKADALVGPDLKGEMMLSALRKLDPFSHPLMLYLALNPFVIFGAIPSFAAAFLFRGGLVLRLLGLAVVKRDGSKASRWLLLWRSFVAWSPMLLMGPVAAMLFPHLAMASSDRVALNFGYMIVAAALALIAALLPGRGLQDRIAGTCLVLRE